MPRLPFNTLQKLDLPLTEIVAGRIGFIHDLFLSFPYEVREALPAGSQDLVVLVGKRKRGARMREIADYPGRVVLVFAPGDAAIRGTYMPRQLGLPPNVVAAYAANNQLADRRAVALPLGVRANKLRTLQFVRQNHGCERRGFLYGNFALNDRHYRPDKRGVTHIRHRLVDQLRDVPWAKLDISSEHRDAAEDLVNYYAQIAKHKFVLSPEGNGIDCYRTWEALYLGAIPIVMVSTATSAFTDLPMLFTEDYGELSEDYLERCWREMSSRSFEIERMLGSYYLHRFLESLSALEDPRFICWQVDDSPSPKFISALRRSSHSASGIVTETPAPPFTGRRKLTNPEDWDVPDGLHLTSHDDGLLIACTGGAPGTAEFPLQTIAGGPFRVTGSVVSRSNPGTTLTVAVRDAFPASGTAAKIRVAAHNGEDLSLDFIASSDRSVLSIEPSTSTAGDESWLLTGLSLRARL